MKTKTIVRLIALLNLFSGIVTAAPLGTTFSYQGQLASGGQAANGSYDLTFTLYDDAGGGTVVAGPLTNSAVAVSNGLFSVSVDFGVEVFTGDARWLEVGVRTNGGGAFTTLSPRQPILPVPYAIMANTASNLTGTLPAAQLSGTVGNSQLANSSITVNAGTGLSGGGAVALGDATTLSNSGVLSVTGNSDITASPTTGNVSLGSTATSANTASTIVKRDASGNFIAGTITAGSFVGSGASLTGVVPANNSVTSAKIADGTIADADVSATGISGSKIIGGDLQAMRLKVGAGHILGGIYATIAGGYSNTIQTYCDYSAIGGGYINDIGTYSTYSAIGGGYDNNIGTNSAYSAIGGGIHNNIAANSGYATIAGGVFNDIGTNSDYSAIGGGGYNNIAADSWSATIAGGYYNDVGTNSGYAFAAGSRAKANHQGAFVWGDSTAADIASTTANSVTMRASGGYRLFSNSGATAGVSLAAGGTAWAVISDRNVKKNFQPVDSREVLERLAALPITRWNYQWEADDGVPHLGPMAQDFKAAFYPGTDDKSITTQEADGVELAAIQGLNQKVEAQRAENAELKRELTELKRLVNQLSTKLAGGAK